MGKGNPSPAAFLEFEHPWVSGPLETRLLSSFDAMVLGSAIYVIFMFVLSYLTRHRRPPQVKTALPYAWIETPRIVHNLLMFVYSAYALVGSTLVFWNNFKTSTCFDDYV